LKWVLAIRACATCLATQAEERDQVGALDRIIRIPVLPVQNEDYGRWIAIVNTILKNENMQMNS
jgi:hypothetical protein